MYSSYICLPGKNKPLCRCCETATKQSLLRRSRLRGWWPSANVLQLKFVYTLSGSNLLELLVTFAFLIEIWNLWQSWYLEWSTWQWPDNPRFATAILITRHWVFVRRGSKKAEDLSVRLAAASTSFQTCRWELRWDMRAIEIWLHKSTYGAFWPSGCGRGFAIQGSWRGLCEKTEKTGSLEPESFVELCQDDVVLVSSNRRFPRLLLTRSEVLRLSGQETLPKAPPRSSVEHVKRENELMGEIS